MGILILIRFQHSLSEIYIHFRNHFFQSCAVRQTAFCRVSAQHCTENYVVIFIFIFPYFEHSRRHPTAKYTQNSFLFLSFAARARLFSAPSVSLNGTSLCQRRPNATSLSPMCCVDCLTLASFCICSVGHILRSVAPIFATNFCQEVSLHVVRSRAIYLQASRRGRWSVVSGAADL